MRRTAACWRSSKADEQAIARDELRLTLPDPFHTGDQAGKPRRATLTDQAIQEALAAADGQRQVAAQRLGISRTTLWSRLRTLP